MQFLENNQGSILLSRNVHDIRLSCPDSSKLDVTVRYGLDKSITTRLIPLDGILDIPLRDILRSIRCIPEQQIIGPRSSSLTLPHFAIDVTDPDSEERIVWTAEILDGGVDSQDASILDTQWMTWRPQVSATFTQSLEFLNCILAPSYNGNTANSMDIYVDVFTAVSGKHTVKYASHLASPRVTILSVNVSYSEIVKHNEIAPLVDDNILAYDVYARAIIEDADGNTVSLDQIRKQRFIVKPNPSGLISFLFRNTIGVLEGISSTGESVRKVSSEIASFISGMTESILTNEASRSYEINTGFIDSERALTLWEDFLSSTEHYYVRPNGGIQKIIIDNPDTKATLRKLNSLSFSFRFAERLKGHFYENRELDYFDYDTAEL